MTRKYWAILSLSLLIFSLIAIVGGVILVDPFEIYHQATAFIPPITNSTQSYSNAGIAKSYEYDSVIIGSSMTENFVPSQLDRLLGGQFIKLCINGGSPFNHAQMMELAFRTHDVKTIFYGIDIESMTYFYKTPKSDMPEYLYDAQLGNDVQYWFNKSVLAKYIPACLRTLGETDPDQRDTMYAWGDLYPYGKEAALRNLTIDATVTEQVPENAVPTMAQQTKLNVEHNLIPFIEAHPDTEFIFFFPPYSIARWYEFYRQGDFGYHLNQKDAVISALLPYKNVRIYDFHAEFDWITNLDHYIDTWHYGPWINSAIVEAVSKDQNRITDVSQVKPNNDLLRSLVDQIVAAGRWPDAFSR